MKCLHVLAVAQDKGVFRFDGQYKKTAPPLWFFVYELTFASVFFFKINMKTLDGEPICIIVLIT